MLMPASTKSGPTDALTAARFSLTIDGVEIGQFYELAGITSEVEPVDLMETTGDQLFLKRLPGKRVPPTVTLKRGKNKDMGVFAWHQSVVEGLPAARKSCTLTMFAADGTAIARYHLESAWPSKVEISGLKAGASEVLYETVTLTCDGIRRVAP
jgi:phage tail-like protein